MEAEGAWPEVANFSQEGEDRSSSLKEGPSGRGEASQEGTHVTFYNPASRIAKMTFGALRDRNLCLL